MGASWDMNSALLEAVSLKQLSSHHGAAKVPSATNTQSLSRQFSICPCIGGVVDIDLRRQCRPRRVASRSRVAPIGIEEGKPMPVRPPGMEAASVLVAGFPVWLSSLIQHFSNVLERGAQYVM